MGASASKIYVHIDSDASTRPRYYRGEDIEMRAGEMAVEIGGGIECTVSIVRYAMLSASWIHLGMCLSPSTGKLLRSPE